MSSSENKDSPQVAIGDGGGFPSTYHDIPPLPQPVTAKEWETIVRKALEKET